MRNSLPSFSCSVTNQRWRWRRRCKTLHDSVLIAVLHYSSLTAITTVRWILWIRSHHSSFLLIVLWCSNNLQQNPQFNFSQFFHIHYNYHYWNIEEEEEKKSISLHYLTSKRTEPKRIEKTPFTYFTRVRYPFPRPRLWPLIQENNSRAVDNVGLNSGYVQNFLNLRYPYHIMIWRSSNLYEKKQRQSEKENRAIGNSTEPQRNRPE